MKNLNQRINAIMGVITMIMLIIVVVLFTLYFSLDQKTSEVDELQALIDTDYVQIDFVQADYVFRQGDDIQIEVAVNNVSTNTIPVTVVYRVNQLIDGVWYASDTDPNVSEYFLTTKRSTDQVPGFNVYKPTSFTSEQTRNWDKGEYRVQLVYSYNFLTQKEDSTFILLQIV